MRRYRFEQWDVFTSRPYTGNALAIFTDATGLSAEEMQSLARETNLSETTFVIPRDEATERERGVQVRIFLTTQELPFAGHPTLGTAMQIHSSRGERDSEIALDLKVGRIPVRFEMRDGLIFGEMTQRQPEFGSTHPREAIAGLLGLTVDDIAPDLPIQEVSTGNPFVIVPVRTLAAMHAISLDLPAVKKYLGAGEFRNFYLVTTETEDPAARIHARMNTGLFEDPATGSAAGCAAAWMVRHGVAKPDEQVLIEQGLEILRPSKIYVRAGKQADRIVSVRVGGHAVKVMEGEYRLD